MGALWEHVKSMINAGSDQIERSWYGLGAGWKRVGSGLGTVWEHVGNVWEQRMGVQEG